MCRRCLLSGPDRGSTLPFPSNSAQNQGDDEAKNDLETCLVHRVGDDRADVRCPRVDVREPPRGPAIRGDAMEVVGRTVRGGGGRRARRGGDPPRVPAGGERDRLAAPGPGHGAGPRSLRRGLRRPRPGRRPRIPAGRSPGSPTGSTRSTSVAWPSSSCSSRRGTCRRGDGVPWRGSRAVLPRCSPVLSWSMRPRHGRTPSARARTPNRFSCPQPSLPPLAHASRRRWCGSEDRSERNACS